MENDKIEVIVSAPREIRQKPAALSCSAPRKQAGKGLWPLFFAILCVTLLAEAVLFVDTQLAGINKILKDDFRIILIPGGKIPLDQAKVTEEKIRALSGVADVFFVDSQTRLERLQRWDADIIHSIVLLGKNPIPDSFEIHIEEKALGDAASLAESAREACGAGAEAKYKPVQAYAILQVLFYRRFFAFCLSASAFFLIVAGAAVIAAYFLRHGGFVPEFGRSWPYIAAGAAGAADAMIISFAIVYPIKYLSPLWEWPQWHQHACIILAGAFFGWLFFRWKNT